MSLQTPARYHQQHDVVVWSRQHLTLTFISIRANQRPVARGPHPNPDVRLVPLSMEVRVLGLTLTHGKKRKPSLQMIYVFMCN